MAISITDPPELPSAADPSTFNEKALAFFAWLTGDFITDLEGITSEDIANEGRLSGVQKFTHTSGAATYTPTAGTKYAIVDMQAAGGGGGNGNSSGTGQAGGGTGGGAGSRVRVLLDVSAIGTATITHGAAGAGATSAGTSGSDGGNATYNDGTTSFTVTGGTGGPGDEKRTTTRLRTPGSNAAANTITAGANHLQTLLDKRGRGGEGSICVDAAAVISGRGADSDFGTGGLSVSQHADGITDGNSALSYGAGGGGGASIGSQPGGADGGSGSPAITLVYEFTA